MTKLELAIIIATISISGSAHGRALRSAISDMKREFDISSKAYSKAMHIVSNKK